MSHPRVFGSKVYVQAEAPFSKRYLKYLTKKFLKKKQLRDWLRVVANNKSTYELRYFKIHDQYNGMPVFRQEYNLDGSPNGLLVFFEPVMEGWVMEKSMLDANEGTYVAWGRPSDGHMGPRKMHLPYW